MIINALATLLQNVISLAGVAWLLLMFQWPVLLILIAAVIPGMLVRLVFSGRQYLRERSYTDMERRAAYYHWMLVGKELAKEIRMFGLGPTFINRFQSIRTTLRRIRLELDLKNAWFAAAAQTLSVVLVFGAYFWVARDAVRGVITVGAFVMFYQAFQKGQTFLQAALEAVARLYENNLFLTNLYEFLDTQSRPTVIETGDGHPSSRGLPASGIVFEDVWFSYPGSDETVLRGVSLQIDAGQVAALVGLNGAGKTTLVKLLCRLYEVNQGRILLDGVDVRRIDPLELRSRLAVVFQDYVQYNLTARDNIWFGNVRRSDDPAGLSDAARQAGIDEALRALPKGYESTLGRLFDNGHELSIGQWQKVALARAFFRNTDVVVLDEPTSSMDPKAEYELFSGFHQILGGRTAILISHRMSTVRMADCIYVLQDGAIAESGSHAELMSADGIYRDLFETQARHYRMQGAV